MATPHDGATDYRNCESRWRDRRRMPRRFARHVQISETENKAAIVVVREMPKFTYKTHVEVKAAFLHAWKGPSMYHYQRQLPMKPGQFQRRLKPVRVRYPFFLHRILAARHGINL